MRIIAGSRRGMNLLGPGTRETRPITDRVKESLFSVLYKYDVIEGGVVADLFCGTGSMGLESISRGAKQVTFVEQSAKVVDILKRNIEKARFSEQSKVICGDVFKVGAPVAPDSEKYNLIFVDPPYAMARDCSKGSQVEKLLTLLCGQVAEGGIITVRAHKLTSLLDEYGILKVIDRRQWGNMAVTILQNKGQRTDDDE